MRPWLGQCQKGGIPERKIWDGGLGLIDETMDNSLSSRKSIMKDKLVEGIRSGRKGGGADMWFQSGDLWDLIVIESNIEVPHENGDELRLVMIEDWAQLLPELMFPLDVQAWILYRGGCIDSKQCRWKSYTMGRRGVGIANPTPAWGSSLVPDRYMHTRSNLRTSEWVDLVSWRQ